MVRPPDEPRRQVEGNPIRLDSQVRRGRADPYREAAVFRAPHRVVGRSRSRLSRIRTEPIDEVNRDNAISRRIFQNMHIRNRSNNIEHNSMVHRNYLEQTTPAHLNFANQREKISLALQNFEPSKIKPPGAPKTGPSTAI
ncbi:uncharacterized protein LOC132717949 [Ruditapes philippinarum]|uniref:uncharacterized protein LOC132717949 n=1 Tax=Ruditapes philippinarum TaxID=129788 RepID=UPI00295ABFAF|nr:uncharacterized protein LOC132717949 [Ruditapes philippinarum]